MSKILLPQSFRRENWDSVFDSMSYQRCTWSIQSPIAEFWLQSMCSFHHSTLQWFPWLGHFSSRTSVQNICWHLICLLLLPFASPAYRSNVHWRVHYWYYQSSHHRFQGGALLYACRGAGGISSVWAPDVIFCLESIANPTEIPCGVIYYQWPGPWTHFVAQKLSQLPPAFGNMHRNITKPASYTSFNPCIWQYFLLQELKDHLRCVSELLTLRVNRPCESSGVPWDSTHLEQKHHICRCLWFA